MHGDLLCSVPVLTGALRNALCRRNHGCCCGPLPRSEPARPTSIPNTCTSTRQQPSFRSYTQHFLGCHVQVFWRKAGHASTSLPPAEHNPTNHSAFVNPSPITSRSQSSVTAPEVPRQGADSAAHPSVQLFQPRQGAGQRDATFAEHPHVGLRQRIAHPGSVLHVEHETRSAQCPKTEHRFGEEDIHPPRMHLPNHDGIVIDTLPGPMIHSTHLQRLAC